MKATRGKVKKYRQWTCLCGVCVPGYVVRLALMRQNWKGEQTQVKDVVTLYWTLWL